MRPAALDDPDPEQHEAGRRDSCGECHADRQQQERQHGDEGAEPEGGAHDERSLER